LTISPTLYAHVFCIKVVRAAFMYLQFKLVLFDEISLSGNVLHNEKKVCAFLPEEKAVLKMLVKLATDFINRSKMSKFLCSALT
jgi:hypothetical protein